MSNELDLRDYFQILRKRVWWIVSFVLIVTLAAGAYSKFIKNPVYEASTKIVVNRSSSNVGSQQLDINEVNTNIKMIDTYKEIIKTPAVLDKVVEQHPEFGLNADQLKSKISVSSVNNTQVMTLVVRDESYASAAQMVNAVSAIFKQEIPSIFNVENVTILNEANPDKTPGPVAPNVPLNVVIAFIVSLMIAVGVAFLLEYLDDTVKTEEDVENILGLPTLAAITRLQADGLPSEKTDAAKVKKVGELSSVRTSK